MQIKNVHIPLPALLIALMGVLLSLGLWQVQQQAEQRAVEQAFLENAHALERAAQREVGLFLEMLESIRQLHSLSEGISRDMLDEFTRKGMRHQRGVLGAFGFAQRLQYGMREAFEASGPVIVQPGPDGQWVPASPRAQYAPLTWQSPAGGLGLPEGFDLGARPMDASAITVMLTSGQTAVAGPALGPHSTEGDRYVFSPILYSSYAGLAVPEPGYLVGFTVAVLRPQHMVERLQTGSGHLMDMAIFPGQPSKEGAELTQETALPIANENWVFRCRATQSFVRLRQTRQPALLLGAGLSITALLTLLMVSVTSRTRRVEALVEERTEALRNSMRDRRRLEEELLSIAGQERERLGRDLHDSLGQKLTGAAFLTKALGQKLDASSPTAQQTKLVHEVLQNATAEVRRIARGLAPVELEDGGLADALRSLAEQSSELYGIEIRFRHDENSPHPEGTVAEHLYRITQEAINNAVRHGGAKSMRIMLVTDAPGHTRMEIDDDGCGFDEATLDGLGLGLRLMRYRAELAGGELKVQSDPAGGTRVIYQSLK